MGKWWLLAGVLFALLFGAFDLSTWGQPERTIPRALGWDASTTAGAFFVFVVMVGFWWRAATGPKPPGYRSAIPDPVKLVLLMAFAAFVAWLINEGKLY